MDISVIICTHNRAEFLRKCLHSTLAQVAAPGVTWEIVVVANGCTDATATVVGNAAAVSGAPLRLVEDPVANLSHARNLGAIQARGDMLIFLDDDAQPAADWLAAYGEQFRLRPEVEAGGGPIHLDWGNLAPPSYWRPEFDGTLAALSLDPAMDLFPAGQFPFGGNMFLSAGRFRLVGSFDCGLGMHGGQIGLGEETDWFLRHAASGGRIGYVPRAIVRHWVNPQKLTRTNLRRRAWHMGVAAARLHCAPRETRGLARWARHCLAGALRGRLDLSEQLYLLRWLGQLWGQRSEP